jgi:hypothetical protein
VDLDPCVHQNALVDAVQARDLAVLVLEQRRPVEARLADAPAVGGGDLEILAPVRGVGKELLGNAADVDAGAAEAARLGDGDLCAIACRDAARAYPARAAAYREKVVIETQTTSDSED